MYLCERFIGKRIKFMSKPTKVVVVDDNTIAIESIRSHFSNNEEIKIQASFNNGEEALQYLINHSGDVDIVVLELLLPRLDGVSLLEEMKTRNIKTKVIVTSSYKDNIVISNSDGYNVSCYLLKPYSMISLEKRIKDAMSRKYNNPFGGNSIDLDISQLLHNLGIPSHIKGYKYIRECVLIASKTNNCLHITKDLYPEVAVIYGTTSSRVERAIRHAIEISWSRGDIKLMDELFGFSVSLERSKPTNSEFISTLADRIKLDCKIG